MKNLLKGNNCNKQLIILYPNQFSHIALSCMKHIQNTYLQDILLIVTTSFSTVYCV